MFIFTSPDSVDQKLSEEVMITRIERPGLPEHGGLLVMCEFGMKRWHGIRAPRRRREGRDHGATRRVLNADCCREAGGTRRFVMCRIGGDFRDGRQAHGVGGKVAAFSCGVARRNSNMRREGISQPPASQQQAVGT